MDIRITEEEVAEMISALERVAGIIGLVQGRADRRELQIESAETDDGIIYLPFTKKTGTPGKKQVLHRSLIEEVKAVLVKLDVKGSLRERSNGLLEFRSAQIGSIYGRSKEELEKKLRDKIGLLRVRDRSRPKRIGAPLLSEFFEEKYLPYKKNQNRVESTLKGISYNFSFIVKSGFDKRMDSYTPAMIEEFIYSIPSTRKRQLIKGLLNNMFQRAAALSVVKVNPLAALDPVKHTGEEGTALSFLEQEDFFQTLFASQRVKLLLKLYYIFVFLTGARRCEALDLRISDVNFRAKLLHLPGTKTGGSDRDIPLYPLVEKLLALIVPRNDRFFLMSKETVDAGFRRITEKHKLHDLRHTFGTLQLCIDKLDPKTVSLIMGHSNINTTLGRYTHPEQLDKGLFLRGDLSDQEKLAIMRERKAKIMKMIEEFLNGLS